MPLASSFSSSAHQPERSSYTSPTPHLPIYLSVRLPAMMQPAAAVVGKRMQERILLSRYRSCLDKEAAAET